MSSYTTVAVTANEDDLARIVAAVRDDLDLGEAGVLTGGRIGDLGMARVEGTRLALDRPACAVGVFNHLHEDELVALCRTASMWRFSIAVRSEYEDGWRVLA